MMKVVMGIRDRDDRVAWSASVVMRARVLRLKIALFARVTDIVLTAIIAAHSRRTGAWAWNGAVVTSISHRERASHRIFTLASRTISLAGQSRRQTNMTGGGWAARRRHGGTIA